MEKIYRYSAYLNEFEELQVTKRGEQLLGTIMQLEKPGYDSTTLYFPKGSSVWIMLGPGDLYGVTTGVLIEKLLQMKNGIARWDYKRPIGAPTGIPYLYPER